MASHKTEWSVGAFIVMGFACAVALAFASTSLQERLTGDSYSVQARFSNTGELKVRAPVKTAGVKIGEVTGIVLDPRTYEAVATLRIARSAGELPADSSAAIFTSGLLGERYVGISPGGDPVALQEGDEILLTQSAVVLEELIGKFMFSGGDKDKEKDAAPATGGSSEADNDDAAGDAAGAQDDGTAGAASTENRP